MKEERRWNPEMYQYLLGGRVGYELGQYWGKGRIMWSMAPTSVARLAARRG